jgi:hypothetical protein
MMARQSIMHGKTKRKCTRRQTAAAVSTIARPKPIDGEFMVQYIKGATKSSPATFRSESLILNFCVHIIGNKPTMKTNSGNEQSSQKILPVKKDQCGRSKAPRRFSVIAPQYRHGLSFSIPKIPLERTRLEFLKNCVSTLSLSTNYRCSRKDVDRVMETT